MNKRIYLSLAQMGGAELDYIHEAFNTNWIVPLGPNVSGFEKDLEHFLGEDRRVVALSSGTAALHLALVQLGITSGDEVICQSFTFTASANPIIYQGATPVFVDSEAETWNLSPKLLEQAICDRKAKTGLYPKAIIVVHLYGMPALMDEILRIASHYRIPLIEDAAEALGSTWKGHQCGTLGEYGILSFNGNKIITTSGGGALVCRSQEQAKEIAFLATQSKEDRPYYHHERLGYNYRLSNVCAGIGRGQMKILDRLIKSRQAIHNRYNEALSGIDGVTVLQNPNEAFDSNFWLTTLLIDPAIHKITPDEIRLRLESHHIESRLLWKPLHLQPVFRTYPAYVNGTSEAIFKHGLCLPSGSSLSNEEVDKVIFHLYECFDHRV